MTILHIISHTHWDREWYLPFQQYRLRLVSLIDNLIRLLEDNNGYAHFMLDGQTIVLDDYIEVRPENEPRLRRLVQNGRISIGPWHILPDEFLVSPEATIRNLLQGAHTSRRFGSPMAVGYIPDPFGHIAQMPQILQGFGIETACFQRGLSDEPCELIWEAPDGSRVLTSYLRDGYGNAAYLSLDQPDLCKLQVSILKESLKPFARSSHLLLMQGTDHTWAEPETSSAVQALNASLKGDTVTHSSLPAYFEALRSELGSSVADLPIIQGDLRDSRRSPLLPGVLSARMWIKQRNHASQVLLEKWVEPFCTLAELHAHQIGQPQPILKDGTAGLIRTAWRKLMECHPHDSICGCSVDQVHAEMKPRFDQVQQIGEDLTNRALTYLASHVDTTGLENSLVVFNPLSFECTGQVRVWVSVPEVSNGWIVSGPDGRESYAQVLNEIPGDEEILLLNQAEYLVSLGRLSSGEFSGQRVSSARFTRQAEVSQLWLILGDQLRSAADLHKLAEIKTDLISNPPESLEIHLVHNPRVQLEFTAANVPGMGWQAFQLKLTDPPQTQLLSAIENEYLTVSLSSEHPGCLDILDKTTGKVFTGQHFFSSTADCGDEYNYCPLPEDDAILSTLISSEFKGTPAISELLLEYELLVPISLSPDRKTRSQNLQTIRIQSHVVLAAGIPRLDFHTTVMNSCQDHRLRVHFAAPIDTDSIWSDGHFRVFQRNFTLPEFDDSWIEQPRPESYQRVFSTLTNGEVGLTIANRGLPEVEGIHIKPGRSEIRLTLLRCVGWLSRSDLSVRRGNAGPALETPDAQMLGSWEFDYSLIPHPGGWSPAFQQAYAFETPMRAVQTSIHIGTLPWRGQFISIQPPEFHQTSFKTAEDGHGVILRGVNLSDQTITPEITMRYPFRSVSTARLDETEVDEVLTTGKSRSFPQVRSHEILSILYKKPY